MATTSSPAKKAAVLAIYMGVWLPLAYLLHISGKRQEQVNPSILVVMVESCKVMMSVGSLLFESGVANALAQLASSRFAVLLRQYFPAAVLYAAYNNLMFLNLKNISPTPFMLLRSSKLLMVAVVWQRWFDTPISRTRIMSMVLICAGIIFNNLGKEPTASGSSAGDDDGGGNFQDIVNIMLVIVQMACTVGASVYNESCLKGTKRDESIHLHNASLYLTSIAINFVLAYSRDPEAFASPSSNSEAFTALSLSIVFFYSIGGIATSFVLKHVDSVSKDVTGALEMPISAVISYFLFDIGITLRLVASIFMVTSGTAIYAMDDRFSKRYLPPFFTVVKGDANIANHEDNNKDQV